MSQGSDGSWEPPEGFSEEAYSSGEQEEEDSGESEFECLEGDGGGRDSVTGSSCTRSSAEVPHRSQRAGGSKAGGSKGDGDCGEVDQDDDVSDTEEGTGTGGRCTDRKYRVRFSGEHVLVPLHHLTGDHCH